VTDDVIERFMSEGCWERLEDFLKVENTPSTGQAALVKKLSVTQVLRYPAIHDWLLYRASTKFTLSATYAICETRRYIARDSGR
jgi:hypothetical protein